ncbi:MAG: beta-ketoacyl synthase chain length factor [Aquaticitalea sp.]
MKPCYIHSAASISAQHSFETESLELHLISGKKVEAIHPNYKNFISPIALRRMATGVKMGVATATKALQIAKLQQPDAILTGTGMGCIEDTEKFLNAIIENEEEFLTPTAFIQSTHNTVGAQIALNLKCKAYNNTYVHGSLSFESALLDAHLLLSQNEARNILVGGVDELGTEIIDAVRMMEDKTSDGISLPFGEGASFFLMSSESIDNGVELLDIQTFSSISKEAVNKNIQVFLKDNNLNSSDIDALILGTNGDVYDSYYDELASMFSDSVPIVPFKKWCGEFYTASAFGLFLGCEILKSKEIPSGSLQKNSPKSEIKTLLLYNQFKGRDHSFILLRRC